MGPTDDELRKISDDRISEMTDSVIRGGFKIIFPRAEWSNASHCLLIIDKKCRIKRIPGQELEKILEGNVKTNPDEERIIREWYAISAYRHGYEIDRLKKKLLEAGKSGNSKVVKIIRKKLDRVINKYESIDLRDLKKRQLAYYYREKGERLERLYDIIEGDREMLNLRFGLIEGSISENSCDKEKVGQCYEASKGFFADLDNAYNFVSDLKGQFHYSQSTGIAYTDEWALLVGNSGAGIEGRKVKLHAEIAKDGMKDKFHCIVKASELEVKPKDAAEKIELLAPDYLIGSGDRFIYGYKDDNSVIISYSKEGLLLKGEPQKLEREMFGLLRVILG